VEDFLSEQAVKDDDEVLDDNPKFFSFAAETKCTATVAINLLYLHFSSLLFDQQACTPLLVILPYLPKQVSKLSWLKSIMDHELICSQLMN